MTDYPAASRCVIPLISHTLGSSHRHCNLSMDEWMDGWIDQLCIVIIVIVPQMINMYDVYEDIDVHHDF